MTETKFRNHLRELLWISGVWSCSIEHRSGGTAGVPDLLVQLAEFLMPVECKVGEWSAVAEILHSSPIRPSQIRLLDDATRAGVAARLVFGVWNSPGWSGFLLRDVRLERLKTWRKGFTRVELEPVTRNGKLLLPVTQW